MVSMAVSKTADVGSIPATPAKKIKKKCKNIWLFEKKAVSLHQKLKTSEH